MNDQVEQTNATVETPTMQSIEAKNFEASETEAASSYINTVVELCAAENVEPVFNFDPEQPIQDGYGLSVIPLTKRVTGKGFVVEGVCIAAVPSIDNIVAEASGSAWIAKQVLSIMLKNIRTAASKTAEDITSIPLKVGDFITSSRASGLLAFNACAPLYVKALKEKSTRLKFLNKALLRQILSSAAFAEQQLPGVDQAQWVLVINSMIAHAKTESIEAGLLTHWLNTRDQVEVDTGDIDLSDLDDMFVEDDEQPTNEAG